MKTTDVRLFLADPIHDLVIERAKAEGVDLGHYCSGLVTEFLSKAAPKAPNGLPFETHVQPRVSLNGTTPTLPDTVEQILAIGRYVWIEKMEFADAVRKVAKDFKIFETTVRDKCTRRISFPHSQIDTDRFLAMLAHPTELRDYLCHRFPKHSREIIQRFEPLTP